jgi:hypothetical protein
LYDNPYATKFNATGTPTYPIIQGVTNVNGASTYYAHEIGNNEVSATGVKTAIPAFIYPADAALSSPLGPFTINSSTDKIDTRARSRFASLKIANTSTDQNWRFGTFRADVQPDGLRG